MRTSLLINCSKREAQEVRNRAELEKRTVSGYVVHIVIRRVEFAEQFSSTLENPGLFRLSHDKREKVAGPRTTLHIYCTKDEADRIRSAARLGEITISRFVLRCLHNSWETEDRLTKVRGKKT